MPFFDFRCRECDFTFEERVEHGHPMPIECPWCLEKSLEKLVSTGIAGVVKGSKTPCPNIPNKQKEEKPWWRKKDKINKKILKNPIKYIKTGETSG